MKERKQFTVILDLEAYKWLERQIDEGRFRSKTAVLHELIYKEIDSEK